MAKSVVLSIFAAMLLVGCVSVSTATPSPQPQITFGITTPVPSTAATLRVTPSPAVTPTVAPTPTLAPIATPTATPTPTATATEQPTFTEEPVQTPGLTSPDLLFDDTLDDPTSGFGTGTTSGGDIGYALGGLQFETNATGNWIWSSRPATDTPVSTMRVIGEVSPGSEGKIALLCSSSDTELFGAMLSTDGSWAFVKIGSNGAEVLLKDANAGLSMSIFSSTVFAVDCAGTATGKLRMQLQINGTGPIATYESDQGPATFNRAAVYVEAQSDGYSASLDRIAAFGVGDALGTMGSAATDLLGHVPSAWKDTCFESPRPPFIGENSTALVTCFIGAVGAGSDVAEYASFSSKGDMDTAYQGRVASFPVASPVSSCKDGNGEHIYSLDNQVAGRLLCASQYVGIRFDWTDDAVLILSSLVDFEGSYTNAYQDWNGAGPNH